MRTVSFVEHIEFEFEGNVFSKAVTVGDVDNDQNNELVVGNMHGEIFIFKGKDKKPWARCCDLGTITCLRIGDVCNQGINFLVVLTSEGWCHVFYIQHDDIPQDEHVLTEDRKTISLRPAHKQQLVANSKDLIIADIDGDGLNEIVVGYSDRQVRMYRWKNTEDLLPVVAGSLSGQLEMMECWYLAGQLGSVTTNRRTDGRIDLMVSQPGGTYVTLYGKNSPQKKPHTDQEHEDHDHTYTGPSLVFHPLGSARARNIGVTTEVVASISRQKKGEETEVPNYSAICTLDGTLTLVDEDKILWSIYVDHQLFCLTKLDVTGDGKEEVIACSWDGHTYLINLNKQVVRFKFRENVAAFCAGYYAVEKNVNVPCLFYFTFNNRIVVYNKLNMAKIANTNLIETMGQQEGLSNLLSSFNCSASDTHRVAQLYHWCLYGNPSKPT